MTGCKDYSENESPTTAGDRIAERYGPNHLPGPLPDMISSIQGCKCEVEYNFKSLAFCDSPSWTTIPEGRFLRDGEYAPCPDVLDYWMRLMSAIVHHPASTGKLRAWAAERLMEWKFEGSK